MVPTRVKPPRSALALIVVAGLVGLGLGVRTAWRERTAGVREFEAVERARAAARQAMLSPCPALDALAAHAHEDVLATDTLEESPGLADVAILSLDPRERPIVWETAPGSAPVETVAHALRGEPVLGELATLSLADPPETFSRSWSLGVADGRARAAALQGRRRGARAVVAVWVFTEEVR
jgi:hypothetical protein